MAVAKPKVEWITYDYNSYWREYGVLCLAGKWAAVKAKNFINAHDTEFDVITDWVADRKTAIGFVKLLKEQ